MNDDELSRLIRGAFPEASSGTVTARQEHLIDQIMAGGTDASSTAQHVLPRNRWAMLPIAASIAIALTVTVAVIFAMVRPPVAYAATPPLLEITPVHASSQQLLDEISTAVGELDRPAGDTFSFQQWALEFDSGSAHPPRYITPQLITVQMLADGSVARDAWAAESYDRNGEPVDDPQLQSGTPLWSITAVPGEQLMLYVDEPPTEVSGVDAYLRQSGLITEGASGEYFQAAREVLTSRTVSSEQQAAMIAFFATLPDVQVLGETTDRLGRTGIAFVAERPLVPDYSEMLVLSATEGFLAFEWMYTGSDRDDIKAPAVMEYTAWLTERD